MAMSDYILCDGCGQKAIYIGGDDEPEGVRVFCNDKCLMAYVAKRAKSEAKSRTPAETAGEAKP